MSDLSPIGGTAQTIGKKIIEAGICIILSPCISLPKIRNCGQYATINLNGLGEGHIVTGLGLGDEGGKFLSMHHHGKILIKNGEERAEKMLGHSDRFFLLFGRHSRESRQGLFLLLSRLGDFYLFNGLTKPLNQGFNKLTPTLGAGRFKFLVKGFYLLAIQEALH